MVAYSERNLNLVYEERVKQDRKVRERSINRHQNNALTSLKKLANFIKSLLLKVKSIAHLSELSIEEGHRQGECALAYLRMHAFELQLGVRNVHHNDCTRGGNWIVLHQPVRFFVAFCAKEKVLEELLIVIRVKNGWIKVF